MHHEDQILSLLAHDLIYRRIFKVEVYDKPISEEYIKALRSKLCLYFGIDDIDTKYLYSINAIEKDMYDINDDHISILYKEGYIKDITEASEILNVSLLSKKIRKYYLCYQRF
jgi:hypothetical protein